MPISIRPRLCAVCGDRGSMLCAGAFRRFSRLAAVVANLASLSPTGEIVEALEVGDATAAMIDECAAELYLPPQ
jgi:hypothetical protein